MKKIDNEKKVNFEIKDRYGKLIKVSKERFAWWMVNEKNNDNWVGSVFSLESKSPEVEGQKNKLIEKNIKDNKKQIEKPKESLVYGASDDIDSITYFTEIRSKDGVTKESYYRPRSEEEKQQIKKRQEINRKRREQELEEKKEKLKQQTQSQEKKIQTENSPNSDKQENQVEKDNNQQNLFQKTTDNKGNNSKNIYYGVGVIFLVLLAISMAMVVWLKKKK